MDYANPSNDRGVITAVRYVNLFADSEDGLQGISTEFKTSYMALETVIAYIRTERTLRESEESSRCVSKQIE